MRQSLAARASRPQTGETAPSVALRALRSTARAVDIVRLQWRHPTLHCRRTSPAGYAPAGRARPTSPRRATRLRVFAARPRAPAHCAVRSEFALIRPCLTVARAAGPRRGGRRICAQTAPGIRCGGALSNDGDTTRSSHRVTHDELRGHLLVSRLPRSVDLPEQQGHAPPP